MSLEVTENVTSSASTAPLTVSEIVDQSHENLAVDNQGKSLSDNNSNNNDVESQKDAVRADAMLGSTSVKEAVAAFKSVPSTEDEVDRTSVYSLYMEKDFRYYFQHPYFRLFIAYFVTFCNFLIYAEDPVSHSQQECFIPVVGQCFAFVGTKYPKNGWAVVKVLLWLTAIGCGLLVGKVIVHQWLFNRCFKLKMFLHDHGSWMTMFFTTIIFLFLFSFIYNGFLLIGGDATREFHISSLMGIKNEWFMKAAACGTWCGDFFTAWMVTDIMLQEKLYPHWAKGARKWWNAGWNRVILFWIIVAVTSLVVVTVIATDWISWDTLNRDFVPSNELMRAFLASFILVMDLMIVMQDWDFPHFINSFDVKLPGLNVAHYKFHVPIPKCLKREAFMVHVTGKWFNYGIIFFVLILDLNMWKNQIFYQPFDYGQYVNPERKVCSVLDFESLENDNASYITWEYRFNTINPKTNETYYMGDSIMNTRWNGFSLPLKSLAFIPSIAAFVCLGILVTYFGRWKPTPTDPHAGRLKKRKKMNRWSRMMQRFSKRKHRRSEEEEEEVADLKLVGAGSDSAGSLEKIPEEKSDEKEATADGNHI